jgi:UDP-N-acetylmuramoyl-tripeptide--D-alanyl-D-alanine ligase
MKYILISIIQSLARAVVAKYHPMVIAITGSVGKSGAKEAISAVLKRKYSVRNSLGNFNTDIGLPITILGARIAPGKNPFIWLGLIARGFVLLIFRKSFPRILVLEMGADKPGDIEKLTQIARPDIAIVTAISPAHTQQFNGLSGVVREKGKLFRSVAQDGWLVVNADDNEIVKLSASSKSFTMSYGIRDSQSDVSASEISVRYRAEESLPAGVSFKILHDGSVTPVILKGVLGEHQVYAALAAASVARILEVHMVEVAEGLHKLEPLPGRMRILKGIKNTIIIDDSYNSSPQACERAVETLAGLSLMGKKYAVLGDMLELGKLSEEEHQKIGMLVASLGIDYLITVGELARDIARGAKSSGMSEDQIFEFNDTSEAGRFVQRRMEEGDIILIKGSRGVHMESITREIMAEPEKADELLVH